jgi:DNA/RNA-binding domain of Phe-tRNA-synthetase-like protein
VSPTQFTLHNDVLRNFPHAQIRFVVAHGLDNRSPWREVDKSIADFEDRLASNDWDLGRLDGALAEWHDAYRRFGSNPRRTKPSLEALARLIERNRHLPRVNPAVDAYNLASVLHGVPAGAFDLAQVRGEVLIRYARGEDCFTPLGEPLKSEIPKPGEVVYAKGCQVLTRHWNHRDCEESKLVNASTDVVFMVERISMNPDAVRRLIGAQRALADVVAAHADDVILCVIDAETPTTQLEQGEPGLWLHGPS